MDKHYPTELNGIKCCYVIKEESNPKRFRFKFRKRKMEVWNLYVRPVSGLYFRIKRFDSDRWFTLDITIGGEYFLRYGYSEESLMRLVGNVLVFYCALPDRLL